MTQATTPRLDIERRLLAALFLYPRVVDLEPAHFLAPAHGALYGALDEVQRQFPVDAPRQAHWYDDVGLALVAWTLRRDKALDLFTCVGGVEHFVAQDLMRIAVTAEAIPDLVEQVRTCPRCGK